MYHNSRLTPQNPTAILANRDIMSTCADGAADDGRRTTDDGRRTTDDSRR
ncbi:MAG TPA: hypothetical protein VJ183_01270 [Chloroflexia bacterium]|nr:hypothetical protein [Chloroflexia bacterium]